MAVLAYYNHQCQFILYKLNNLLSFEAMQMPNSKHWIRPEQKSIKQDNQNQKEIWQPENSVIVEKVKDYFGKFFNRK